MKIATTTGDFGSFLGNDADRIRALHKAGFRYIDFNMYSLTPDCPLMSDNWKDETASLKALADSLGMKFVQAHSQGGNCFKDEHLPPYMGTLNPDEVITALIDSGYKGCFTLECSSALIPKNYWLGGRRHFDKDTRLTEPQLFMQEKMESYLYETAKYMLSSYNVFDE